MPIVEQAIQQIVSSKAHQNKETQAKLRKEQRVWEALRKLLSQAEHRPFAVLSLLEQLRTLQSPYAQALQGLEEELRRQTEEQIFRYGNLLREALKSDGCTIEGRFPEYRVHKVIEVAIDEKRSQARIGTLYCADTIRGDLSVATVAEAVRKQFKRLFERPFEAREFLETVWKGYRLGLLWERGSLVPGESVSIFTVHRFVVWLKQKEALFTQGKGFVPYLPDEFAVDLGRLLAAATTTTQEGYRLNLSPARAPKPKQTLFIVNFKTHTGQHYGQMQFRLEKESEQL